MADDLDLKHESSRMDTNEEEDSFSDDVPANRLEIDSSKEGSESPRPVESDITVETTVQPGATWHTFCDHNFEKKRFHKITSCKKPYIWAN